MPSPRYQDTIEHMRRTGALCALLFAGACTTDGGIVLSVEVKTDLVPGIEFSAVQALLVDPARTAETPALRGDDYLDGRRVADFDALVAGSRTVDVALLDASRAVVAERRVQVTLTESLGVTVVVTRDCRGVSCPGVADDPTHVACNGGHCVDPGCTPETPELCGDMGCASDADCPPRSSCARESCETHACIARPNDASCATGEYCAVEDGCRPDPTARPDGGCTTETHTFYRDADGDGVGVSTDTMNATDCAPPPGYVAEAGDCDDTDPTRSPDAPEACDGIDNDCDGAADGARADGWCGAQRACADGVCEGRTRLAFGHWTTCLRAASGSFYCWGPNQRGSLGTDGSVPHLTASLSPFPAGTVEVVLGFHHGCGRTDGRDVYCWGENVRGQLGQGTASSMDSAPIQVPGLDDVRGLAAGLDHTCAWDTAGAVRCWGANAGGQIGDGTNVDRPAPRDVTLPSPAVSVFAHGESSCARLRNGSLSCWGRNDVGQLGDGTLRDRWSPVTIGGLRDVVDLTGGRLFTGLSAACAVNVEGAVFCMGNNDSGNLGYGTFSDSNVPMRAATGSGMRGIAATHRHACAIAEDRTLFCWGSNTNGAGGGPDFMNAPTPQPATALGPVDVVGAGDGYTCAVRATGEVVCFGGCTLGRCGDGGGSVSTAVSGLTGATMLALSSTASCAVRAGTLECWGVNVRGQFGDGTTVGHADPRATPLPASVSAAAFGANHGCALLGDGTLRCFGVNGTGQLGNGGTTDSPAPVDPGLSGVTAVAAGARHTCAVVGTGSVRCMGDNPSGQLGDGSTASSSVPVSVVGLTDATKIAAGDEHTCAIRSDRSVVCWGLNTDGELGNDSRVSSPMPVPVVGLTDAVEIDAGATHTCAVHAGGGIACWGNGGAGRLGNGATARQQVPVEVTGITNARDVALGTDYSCAVLADGTAMCWGANGVASLGDGSVTNRTSPVPVMGVSGATSIDAGASHTCALVAGGGARCWGADNGGRSSGLQFIPVVGLP